MAYVEKYYGTLQYHGARLASIFFFSEKINDFQVDIRVTYGQNDDPAAFVRFIGQNYKSLAENFIPILIQSTLQPWVHVLNYIIVILTERRGEGNNKSLQKNLIFKS